MYSILVIIVIISIHSYNCIHMIVDTYLPCHNFENEPILMKNMEIQCMVFNPS
jgi:hypothetical protein